jgi:hypothetical protein
MFICPCKELFLRWKGRPKQTNPIPRNITAAYTHAAAKALLDNNTLSLLPSLSTSVNKTALSRNPSKPTRYREYRLLMWQETPYLTTALFLSLYFFLPPLIKRQFLGPPPNQTETYRSNCRSYYEGRRLSATPKGGILSVRIRSE